MFLLTSVAPAKLVIRGQGAHYLGPLGGMRNPGKFTFIGFSAYAEQSLNQRQVCSDVLGLK